MKLPNIGLLISLALWLHSVYLTFPLVSGKIVSYLSVQKCTLQPMHDYILLFTAEAVTFQQGREAMLVYFAGV